MGFELTPRERRWFDAILVLGALALGFIVLSFVGVLFAYFNDLILVFFLAWLMAFMLSPVIIRVSRIPFMSRAGAIFTVYFLLFGSLVVLSIVIATALVNSLADFAANLPGLRDNLPAILQPWQDRLNALGIGQVDLVAQATVFLDNLSNYAVQLAAPLQQIAVASLGAIGNLLLVVVLSLYIVADRERLTAFLFWLVPSQWKVEAQLLEEAVSRSFGGFIRGQVITGLVYAVVALLANILFGLEFAAVTTAAAGLLMAIPFFGPFVAWAPPVLVAVLFKSDATLGVAVVMAVGWLLLLNLLQPRIMADSLRIHPIVVLGSVLVGLKVAGIPGAIFGIPIAAVISALILHSLGRRRGTGPVAARAAHRVGTREGRTVRTPREPDPHVDSDVEVATAAREAGEAAAAESRKAKAAKT